MTALDDLRTTLLGARKSQQAYWVFTEKRPDRDKIVYVHNLYIGFFSIVVPSLWTNYILKLASVFDQDGNSISLKSIPNASSRTNFDNLWTRGRKLFQLRNKVIAHRDARLLPDKMIFGTDFTYNDVAKILHDACAFFDVAAEDLSIEPIPDLSAHHDLVQLITDVASWSDATSWPIETE
jgi:hypothetical protein